MIKINKKYKIKKKVDHQDIGGKEILIERKLTPDEVDDLAMGGNIACLNFCIRRDDFLPEFNKDLYYGHVGNLGYVVCEDELEECSEEFIVPDLKGLSGEAIDKLRDGVKAAIDAFRNIGNSIRK